MNHFFLITGLQYGGSGLVWFACGTGTCFERHNAKNTSSVILNFLLFSSVFAIVNEFSFLIK